MMIGEHTYLAGYNGISELKSLVDAARLGCQDAMYWWSLEQHGKTQ